MAVCSFQAFSVQLTPGDIYNLGYENRVEGQPRPCTSYIHLPCTVAPLEERRGNLADDLQTVFDAFSFPTASLAPAHAICLEKVLMGHRNKAEVLRDNKDMLIHFPLQGENDPFDREYLLAIFKRDVCLTFCTHHMAALLVKARGTLPRKSINSQNEMLARCLWTIQERIRAVAVTQYPPKHDDIFASRLAADARFAFLQNFEAFLSVLALTNTCFGVNHRVEDYSELVAVERSFLSDELHLKGRAEKLTELIGLYSLLIYALFIITVLGLIIAGLTLCFSTDFC